MTSCPHCEVALGSVDIQANQCPACQRPLRAAASVPAASPGKAHPRSFAADDFSAEAAQAKTILRKSSSASASATIRQVETLWQSQTLNTADTGATIKQSPPPSAARAVPSGETKIIVKQKVFARDRADNTLQGVDYELGAQIGAGGMGEVVEARQTAIDRIVAIKMIKGDAGQQRLLREKFLAEAAVTGDLDHPNIVPIHDLGETRNGQLFYAMKYVRGRPWSKDLLTLSMPRNLEILLRTADAVAYAHNKGVIHRDLKPENIMLGDFGEVLVLDWGLAAAVTPTGKAEPLTTCDIGGTPSYIAPEMVMGEVEKIGVRSDVYLLGAILYEIITGKPPHSGKSVPECLLNAADNIIRPTEHTGELVDIARRAMATVPTDRFPTVKEFQQAVRDYQDHAESLAMSASAASELEKAKRMHSYQSYAEALFSFKGAGKLWDVNPAVKSGIEATRLAYGEHAFSKGDLDLASSVLDRTYPQQAKLLNAIINERLKRAAAKRRLKTLTVGSIGMLVLIAIALPVYIYQLGKAHTETEASQQTTANVYESARRLHADTIAAYTKAAKEFDQDYRNYDINAGKLRARVETYKESRETYYKARDSLAKRIAEMDALPKNSQPAVNLYNRRVKTNNNISRHVSAQRDRVNREGAEINARQNELARAGAVLERRKAELIRRCKALTQGKKELDKTKRQIEGKNTQEE